MLFSGFRGGWRWLVPGCVVLRVLAAGAEGSLPPVDPRQMEERTCFQTSQPYSDGANLRSDVAIVYGVDPGLPGRIQTWRDRGYRIHVMTGVSWGHYQDYLYGRFDGINHEDEAQTERNGRKISHGGDVYYMCPGTNYGKFLSVGVQRALDAGAEAIHLEEPEFWVRGGYSDGFKREWQEEYGEPWQPPHGSVDAQWRASKLKYGLYRRALQQVFDHVRDYNRRSGRAVRCYVPTHSLLNYAQWRIVSPESSLARLEGCDGYIAQVWTGTARTPNVYRGRRKERTFETAFLEYGCMQNLVRSTGRRVWSLHDPIEDDPNHDWDDYQGNWASTLVASLLQSDVWRFEVAPWPERVFGGRYPSKAPVALQKPIPAGYATVLQTVGHALENVRQDRVEWECGSAGVGVLVSDSLMFQRGDPVPGDRDLSDVYGLALPFLKRGMPVAPVQLENVTLRGYLRGFRLLLLSYDGMKPMTPEVHASLAQWVREGGSLVFCDDGADPFNQVREWWNEGGRGKGTPQSALLTALGAQDVSMVQRIGDGRFLWLHERPSVLAQAVDGDVRVVAAARQVLPTGFKWRETSHLLLRRGPYVVGAGLDETPSVAVHRVPGRYVNLLDPSLPVLRGFSLEAGTRWFLLDLDRAPGPRGGARIVASACKVWPSMRSESDGAFQVSVEGIEGTEGVVLLRTPRMPRLVLLGGSPVSDFHTSVQDGLTWIRFRNTARPRELKVRL